MRKHVHILSPRTNNLTEIFLCSTIINGTSILMAFLLIKVHYSEITKYPLLLCSIICNYEFSSRLSINSILRLRSAAISALSDNSPADTAMIQKLARRILHVNRYHDNGTHGPNDDIIEGYSDRRTAGMHIFCVEFSFTFSLCSLKFVLNLILLISSNFSAIIPNGSFVLYRGGGTYSSGSTMQY